MKTILLTFVIAAVCFTAKAEKTGLKSRINNVPVLTQEIIDNSGAGELTATGIILRSLLVSK